MRNIAITLAAVVAALVACSSSPKPPPQEFQPNPDVEPQKPDPTPPALAESELCPKIIERFRASPGLTAEQDAKLIPIVEKHCVTWPEPTRRCLATAPDDQQADCMNDMDPALGQAFVADLMAAMREPPPCDALGVTASVWITLPAGVAPADGEIAFAAVGPAVVAACRESAWSDTARMCVEDAQTNPRVCLDDAGGAKIDAELKRRTDLYAAAAAFKPTDKKIACAKVAAAHYGDAQWKDKMTGASKKDKKAAAKAASKSLEKACKDEAWTPFVRGCVVAASSEEQRTWCVDASWGYPPGDPEGVPGGVVGDLCDPFAARFAACASLDVKVKEAMAKVFVGLKSAATSQETCEKAAKGWDATLSQAGC